MAEAGEAAGMPAGLVSCLRTVSMAGTRELMEHYATSLILATGGSGMVRAAHSVGKPALGVGPGNVPVYVDRSADVARAAADIVASKSFDCSTICSTEQTVVADRPIAAELRSELVARGAHWLTPEEAARLGGLMFRPSGIMDPRFVGQTPQRMGEIAGIDVPGSARVLVADIAGVGPDFPLSREKLTTVLGFIEEDGWRAGCERSIELLKFGGDGHSLSIHARDEDVVLAFGIEKPAFRILVNTLEQLRRHRWHHRPDAVHDARTGRARWRRRQRQHHRPPRAERQARRLRGASATGRGPPGRSTHPGGVLPGTRPGRRRRRRSRGRGGPAGPGPTR